MSRQAMEMALDCLLYYNRREAYPRPESPTSKTIDALRAALAEAEAPKAEPVAWMHNQRVDCIHNEVKELLKRAGGHLHRPLDKTENYTIPLYTHPPESVDEEVIGTHPYGDNTNPATREWWSGGAWLYPGDTVVVRRTLR